MSDNTVPDWLKGISPEQPAKQVKQRFSTFGIVAILLTVGLLIMIGYALLTRDKGSIVGKPAPKFTITTYDTNQIAPYDNQTIKLASLKGQVVVINIWASYCEPCKEEQPMLERVWRDVKDNGVVFLGISNKDVEANSLAYLKQYDVTYPNGPDEGGKIYDKYHATGIPETFIIGRDGKVKKHFISAMSERDLRAAIQQALEG